MCFNPDFIYKILLFYLQVRIWLYLLSRIFFIVCFVPHWFIEQPLLEWSDHWPDYHNYGYQELWNHCRSWLCTDTWKWTIWMMVKIVIISCHQNENCSKDNSIRFTLSIISGLPNNSSFDINILVFLKSSKY